ncbi:hypothetical protein P3S68_008591 [Capsicum galapagoense]
MNTELVEFCKREIDNLLQKGLIKSSKSPWLCTAFYINNAAEKELGMPRLVINYKPLNEVLKWIRHVLWQAETLLLQKDTYLNYSQALSYTSQTLSQNLHGNTITCLRSAKLNSFVPFDDNINFHKAVAATIVTSIIPCRQPPCIASLRFLNLLIDSLASMHFGICTTFLSLSTSCWSSMVAAFKVLWHLILACDFEVRQTLDKVILTLKDLNMGEYPGLNDRWMDVISSQGSSLLSLDRLGSDVTDSGLTYLKDCKNMQALNPNYCDQIIDHRVENISGKYSFSSNVHGNRYGVIEEKEGVNNSLIMPAVITPGDMLDLSTVLFRSRIIFIGTLINYAVA